MKPDQTILVQLVDQSGRALHLDNVVIDIGFFTGDRFRYSFRLKPTNHNGELSINYQDIEAKRKESSRQSLMDYNTPLMECDNRVQIGVPTADELRKAFEIATRWAGGGITPEYAKMWLTANNAKIKAQNVFIELMERENFVPIPCEIVE